MGIANLYELFSLNTRCLEQYWWIVNIDKLDELDEWLQRPGAVCILTKFLNVIYKYNKMFFWILTMEYHAKMKTEYLGYHS